MSDQNKQPPSLGMAAVMSQLTAMHARRGQSEATDNEQYFTLDFNPPSDQYADISHVTVVVSRGRHSGQFTPSGQPLYPYHFRIFFPIVQQNKSVEISVHRLFYSSSHGKVVVQSRNCKYSTNNLVSFTHFMQGE